MCLKTNLMGNKKYSKSAIMAKYQNMSKKLKKKNQFTKRHKLNKTC